MFIVIVRVSIDELAGLSETANCIFKIMECLRVGNNDFTLSCHGIYCIPVFAARLRKRNTFYFWTSSLA